MTIVGAQLRVEPTYKNIRRRFAGSYVAISYVTKSALFPAASAAYEEAEAASHDLFDDQSEAAAELFTYMDANPGDTSSEEYLALAAALDASSEAYDDYQVTLAAAHADTLKQDQHIFCSRVVQQEGMKITLANPLPKEVYDLLNPDCDTHPTGLVIAQFYGTHYSGLEADIDTAIDTLNMKLSENANLKEIKAEDKIGTKRTAFIYSLLGDISAHLWVAAEGTVARRWTDGAAGDVYIANGVPSTDFINAYLQNGELIPSNWYHVNLNATVNLRDENGVDQERHCTTLAFYYPLDTFKQPAPGESTHRKNAYTDKAVETISCNLVSSVGENPIDQISFLLGFTNLSPGEGFVATSEAVEKYPAHWTLTHERDSLDLIKDIAYQSRVGIRINAETMDVTYLAAMGSPGIALNEENCVAETLTSGFSGEDKLSTKAVIHWKPTGLPEQTFNKTFNTDKYGTFGYGHLFEPKIIHISGSKESALSIQAETSTYFIYNNRDQVDTVSRFWLNRHACVWRNMRAKVTPDISVARVFDWVSLTFGSAGLTGAGLIVGREVDSMDSLQGYSIWIPTSPDDGATPFGPELVGMPKNPTDREQKVYGAGFYEMASSYEGTVQQVMSRAATARRTQTFADGLTFNAKVTAEGWYREGVLVANTKKGHCTIDLYGIHPLTEPTQIGVEALTGVLTVHKGMWVRVRMFGGTYVVKSINHGRHQ